MLKIKCSKYIMDIFDERISELDIGYKDGCIDICDLEELNNVISSLPLQKHGHSHNNPHMIRITKDEDHIFNGSCGKLDTDTAAIYYCAFCIKAGLHPVLIYYSDHVGAGIWMDEDAGFETENLPVFEAVRNSVYCESENGQLLLIDTWDAIGSTYNFWEGSQACLKRLKNIRMVFDFKSWNNGDLDCIIPDERQYRTDEQTRAFITSTLGGRDFGSVKPSLNFRNVHFFDLSQDDRAISDMIQNNYSFLIRNVNEDKQIILSLDAALNMNCQDKAVMIMAQGNTIEKALGKLEAMRMDNIAELDGSLFDIDDERPVDTLISTMGELKENFISFIYKNMSQEYIEHEPEKNEASDDNSDIKTEFTDNDRNKFLKLADDQKILLKKPKNSDKTLFEIWEGYFSEHMDKMLDNNELSAPVIQDIQAMTANNTDYDKVIEHIRAFSESRKKCIIRLNDDDSICDFITGIDARHQNERFSEDIDTIYQNRLRLNDIYFKICDPQRKNNHEIISFDSMKKYKDIFLKFLAPNVSSDASSIFSSYKSYLEYENKKSDFVGGDFEKYYCSLNGEEQNELLPNIKQVLNTTPLHILSQNHRSARAKTDELIKAVMPHYNRNTQKNTDTLKKLEELIELRQTINDDQMKIFKYLQDIFNDKVSEKMFAQQYEWVKGYINMEGDSIAAERMVRCCSDTDSEIRREFFDRLNDYNNASKNLPEEMITCVSSIKEFLDSSIYDEYNHEKSWLMENRISNYTEMISSAVDEDNIDSITEFFERAIHKYYIEQLFRSQRISMQAIPYNRQKYELLLRKLKKSCIYSIRQKTEDDQRIVFCSSHDVESYQERKFHKLIICGAENIDYELLGSVIDNSENVIFMCEKDDFSSDSVVSLLGEDIMSFDYSKNDSEGN